MGVRFRGSLRTTHTDTEYRVELWDSTYNSTGITEIMLFGEGFQITYEQQGDEIYTAVKGSACKVYAGITRGSEGTLLQNWIYNSVLATKEDLYHVAIYQGSNLYWFGVILPSLGNEPDASRPYDFVIQATDGLARLKDKEFTLATSQALVNYTFRQLIYEVLKATPLYTATTQSVLFSTAVGYYEDTMPSPTGDVDPLEYSSIRPSVFEVIEDNQEAKGKSYYEVLQEICESWGMRVMLSEGIYRFYQVQSYEDDGITRYERFYSRSNGLYLLNDTFNGYPIDVPDAVNKVPEVTAGNQWEFYDPLQFVFLRFPFDSTANMLDGLEDFTALTGKYSYTKTLRNNIIGGAAKRLNVAITIRALLPLTSLQYNVFINIKLKIGSNYLSKSLFSTTSNWGSNSALRYSNFYPNLNQGLNTINIAFQTPDIPSGTHDNNEFVIEMQVYDAVTNALIATNLYDAKRQAGSSSIKFNSSSTDANETYFEYIGGNTATPINSYDLELPDTRIGEGVDASNPGNIYVSADGVNYTPSTGQWKVEGLGSAYDFCLIRLRDVLSAQTIPIRKYQGSILGAMIYAHNAIEYDGKRYILNGANYNASSEKWDGEWIEISYDRASFAEIQGATNQSGSGGEQQLRKELGALFYRDSIGLNFTNSLIEQQRVNYITTGVDGALTQLPVGIFTDTAREGDYLRVFTPDGGGNEVVRVSADSTGSFVSIDAATANFPENSFVFFDIADIIERVRLGTTKVFTISADTTLKPFTQKVINTVDGTRVYLPSLSESFGNNRSIEIVVKTNVNSGSGSGTTYIDGNGADIDTPGNTEVTVNNTHAVTLFNDGSIWFIESSFKHP